MDPRKLVLALLLFALVGVTIAGAAQTTTGGTSTQNIVQIVQSNPNFSTLATALDQAGLTRTLSGSGPFTVFAPTNTAFEALPPGSLNALLANKTALTNILNYHVVLGELRVDTDRFHVLPPDSAGFGPPGDRAAAGRHPG